MGFVWSFHVCTSDSKYVNWQYTLNFSLSFHLFRISSWADKHYDIIEWTFIARQMATELNQHIPDTVLTVF